jgi:hypothetical protein
VTPAPLSALRSGRGRAPLLLKHSGEQVEDDRARKLHPDERIVLLALTEMAQHGLMAGMTVRIPVLH